MFIGVFLWDPLEEVKQILRDLAVSQAKSENSLENTKKILDDLAVSQAKTEKNITRLEFQVEKLATQVGGFEKTHPNVIENLFFNSL